MDEPSPPASAWWPALAGAVLCAALLLLDAVWGPERIISSTVVIAPFLTALRGTTRQTACVGALALAGCALSGTWNENFGSVEYLLRLAVVGAGASFAVLAARTRIRLDASRSRVALIAAVGDLVVESVTLEETVERLGDAIVPAFADLLVLDVVRGSAPRRLLARAHGPHASELEAALGRDSELLERAGTALCTVACLVLRETPGGAEVRHGRAGDPAHAGADPGTARTVSGALTSRLAATA